MFASHSDVGRQRRSNQDAFGELPGAGASVLLVCCDGMGGHQGGEVASRVAVETICKAFDAAAPGESLPRAVFAAHAAVRARAGERVELHGMGTTAVALYFDGERRAWVANVGDSRCYRVREGRIEALTQDHSVVAELLRAGSITPEEAEQRPRNELTRALGANEEVRIDSAEHAVRAGDVFVLCSDGLWTHVDEARIAEIVGRESPAAAVRALVELANANGGSDNVTVQILAVGASQAPESAGAREAGTRGAERTPSSESRAAPERPSRVLRWASLAALALLAGLALVRMLRSA